MGLLDKLLDLSNKLYEVRWIASIRKGLLSIFPLILTGSFAALIRNFDIPFLATFLDTVVNTTLGMMSLILSFTISYNNAASSGLVMRGSYAAYSIGVVSTVSFLIISAAEQLEDWFNFLGPIGLFISIIVSLTASEMFLKIAGRRYLRSRRTEFTEEPVLKQALTSIFPSAVVFSFFGLIYTLVLLLTGNTINSLYCQLWGSLIAVADHTLGFGLILNLLNHFLWFFGIHGNHVLSQVFDSLVVTQGLIINKTFFDVFVFIGGSGATLCMIVAIMLSIKRSNMFRMARFSLIPGLFNINETMTLGIPIVLDPIFLIPFILTPIVFMITSYLAILTGLVPPVIVPVHWATPPLLGGYLATGSIRGLLLQLFNIFAGVLIYLPFVRISEQMENKKIIKIYNKMVDHLKRKEVMTGDDLLVRNDSMGDLARDLVNDLIKAIKKDKLLLEYQPQMDSQGRVKGVEALLRWHHEFFGRIPPVVTITLAEDAHMMNDLGRWVVSKACAQLGEWNRLGIRDLRMCINISPTELSDEVLPETLAASISKYRLDPSYIELEITEGMMVDLNPKAVRITERLCNLGVGLAMDDFGMGYTSLLYIRYFNINTIKIDGSLTKDLLNNNTCQEIISSMVYLCNSLNIKIVAEYVETETQKEVLRSLGCDEYQGYLFSPPLPAENCLHFILANQVSYEEASVSKSP